MQPYRKFSLSLLLSVLALCSSAFGQGRTSYMNVESPPVHPIEVFRLGGHDYLAVASTRDNSIEIWDTDETVPSRRLHRIRVGLEPVTVRFHPRLSRLYTANFLGDSVSVIQLGGGDSGVVKAELVETTWVGDEPLDVAFYTLDEPTGARETLFVTHMSPDGFGWRDADTLAPLSAGLEMVPAAVNVGFDTSDPPDGIPDEFVDIAAKEPQTVLVRGDDLLILAHKGGLESLDSLDADFDLYCDDLTAAFVDPLFHGALGTTGANMVFDSAGVLYMVGAEALSEELRDEPVVRDAPTGFVKSIFFRIESPCSDSPIVTERDVNLELDPMQPPPATRPVVKSDALSLLTDLAAFEAGGSVPKVFFTAFGNDRVGIIEPDPAVGDPNAWALRRIDIPTVNGNPLAGPRGLALKGVNPNMNNDPGERLYVLNHLDASVTTIDPVTETIVTGGELSLTNDPRPQYLVDGQQFLYDSDLSGNGFDSCASCHTDGRTDGQRWDLGAPDEGDIPIPNLLPDATDDEVFPADKNFMVTQSLQGLLNFEVGRADQFWVTNAPYHWRGDRASFLDFNGAFESLLGGDELPIEQMRQFEAFVNSIHYPPNPKQLKDRVPSGEFGVGEDLDTDGSSGAFRGMKIYHISNTVGGQRSCVSCHFLSEGSNNHITDTGVNQSGQIVGQPIETAAMRGLFQKEARRDIDGSSDPTTTPYTGLHGLFHTGIISSPSIHEANLVGSINGFNKTAFSNPVCGTPGAFCPDLQDLNQFVHEFDWGVGPMVGCPATVNVANAADALPGNPASQGCDLACGDLASTLDCLEEQADVTNSGIAVQAWLAGQDRGFWYDAAQGLYVEEPAGGQSLDRAALVNLVGDGDLLVFHGVPLGSERRIAAPKGVDSGPLDGPKPSNLKLLPMVPNSFYERVPELTLRWADFNNQNLESFSMHKVRLYQWGLILEAAGSNGFGLGGGLRHDAPRRFRIAGDDIRHGASLFVFYNNDTFPVPDPNGDIGQVRTGFFSMPLYATGEVDPDTGLDVWETAVEFEPFMYYGFMLGGPQAPGVAKAFLDQKPFTFPMVDPILDQPESTVTGQLPQFEPEPWNWVWAFVLNANGGFDGTGWSRLEIE